MKQKRVSEEITITGYVRAVDWEYNGNVSVVSIEADDEQYVIENNDLGGELFDHLDRIVEVTGTVEDGREGIKRITVISYEALSEADYTDDDDYDWRHFGSEQGESPM